MVRWDEDSAEAKLWLYRKFFIVFFVWAMHAIANVVSYFVTSRYAESNVVFILGTDVL